MPLAQDGGSELSQKIGVGKSAIRPIFDIAVKLPRNGYW